jgi:hypothetical protein
MTFEKTRHVKSGRDITLSGMERHGGAGPAPVQHPGRAARANRQL